MEENKTMLISWVKSNRKRLLLSGISMAVLIGIITGLENRNVMIKLWADLKNCLIESPEKLPKSLNEKQVSLPVSSEVNSDRCYTSPQKAFYVNQHIRTLSEGKHHSPKKAVEAAAMDITLLPNQTLVDSYVKYAA